MNHLNEQQWQAYCKNEMDERRVGQVEEHLLCCDHCMETYLSFMEQEERNADIQLSSVFTDQVMEKIATGEKPRSNNRHRRQVSNLFIYYVAAACITILFSASGVFTSLSGGISQTTEKILDSTDKVESVLSNGWSDRLTNKTVILMNKIKQKE